MNRDVAASVHQRLLNYSSAQGKRFGDVLQHYALERWLFRLSRSEYASRFILKGALLLLAWQLPLSRPTRDIDFLVRADNDLEAILRIIGDICRIEVVEDGMRYDANSVVAHHITEDARYRGVRVVFKGALGNARTPMQVDLGFSDVVTPSPVDLSYPTILGHPAPHLITYNLETAIAEKYEAMVKLGELNSRMKDYFDVWLLASTRHFQGRLLANAVRATFARRATPLTDSPPCFAEAMGQSTEKQTQWRAFVERSELAEVAPARFHEAWSLVAAFLTPLGDPSIDGRRWSGDHEWS